MLHRELELRDKDCTDGNGKACFDLVFWYDRKDLGTTPWIVPDHDRAMKYRERGMELSQQACDRGDGYACHLLAQQYAAHDAQHAADTQRSFALSKRACEQGHAASCSLYASPDEAEVERLLRHGCDLGNADSCGMLAMIVSYQHHDAEALQLLQRACDLRSARHCMKLGAKLDRSDPTGAAAALAKACSFGQAEACAPK